MKRDVKDLEQQVKAIQKKYGITGEDLKILRSVKKSPMLSGRILEIEKKSLVKLSKKRKSTQSDEIRKYLNNKLNLNNIDWKEIKLLKGESIKNLKTVPVRVKVSEEIERQVIKLCNKNKVTISSFMRYMVASYVKENEGTK